MDSNYLKINPITPVAKDNVIHKNDERIQYKSSKRNNGVEFSKILDERIKNLENDKNPKDFKKSVMKVVDLISPEYLNKVKRKVNKEYKKDLEK